MDKYITATKANQNFSGVLRDVAAGSTYTVTSRGRAVAEIRPANKKAAKESLAGMFERMSEFPGVVTGPYTRADIYDRTR